MAGETDFNSCLTDKNLCSVVRTYIKIVRKQRKNNKRKERGTGQMLLIEQLHLKNKNMH